MDEKRVFAVISKLFPRAREHSIGIKSFYLQVQEALRMDLDNNLWIPFVWNTVYTMMNDFRQGMSQDTPVYTYLKYETRTDQENQNSENKAANAHVPCGNILHRDIPLSQLRNSQVNIEHCESSGRPHIVSQHQNENSPSIDTESIAAPNNQYTNTQVQPLSMTSIYESTGENQPFSDRFNIPSRPNDIALSSIDINKIAVSHSHNGAIQNQNQSLSVPLAQQSVNRTHLSIDLNTPKDITDDTSLTLIHTPEQDINNIDNSSDVGESQSSDINSINLNNHVSNDCKSAPMETNHISASHNHGGIIQNQNLSLSVPVAQQSVNGYSLI